MSKATTDEVWHYENNMNERWTKVGEVEINRPASDSAVEVRNPSYIKNVGEFYQAPIDERGTDHLLTCYARAERDEDYDYLHIEYEGGTGFTLRFVRRVSNERT